MGGRGWGAQVIAGAGDAVRALNPQIEARAPARRPIKRARPPVLDLGEPNLPWCFILRGAPRTKNTGRAPGSAGLVVPSAAYRRWFHAAMQQVVAVRAAGMRGTCSRPVVVTAIWYRDRDVGDEDRFKVALGDFLQRAGFVLNDSLIHWSGACRRALDRDRPRTAVLIEEDHHV